MGTLEDFQGFGDRCQRELDQIDTHHDEDLPHVKRYVQSKDGTVTDGTLAVYLKNLRKTGERLNQPIVSLTAADLDAHVYDLRHGDWGRGAGGLADSTIRNLEFAIRDFLDTVDVDAPWVEDYDLTPQPKSKVRPEDMLRGEDIKALREGANNLRDIALIEFLADTGARLTLTGTLRVRDLDLETEQATYRPNPNASGLKGAVILDYPLIDSRATLRTYLQTVHPRPDEPDVAFFHKLPGHGNDWESEDGATSPQVIRGQLRAAADNASVDKPVNPHNFRHSAVTRMRREGYNRSQIEHRVHWEIDSDMWEIYEHIAGEEHNSDIFAAAGVGEDDASGPEAARVRCGNCTELVAPHLDYCGKCGSAVSPTAISVADRAVESTATDMAEVRKQELRDFLGLVLFLSQTNAGFLQGHD